MKLDSKNRLPDKLLRKATITHALRSCISSHGEDKTYLEIGCDICLTVVSLKDDFKKLTAIDNDPERIEGSKNTIEKYCNDDDKAKINLIYGTSSDVPLDTYDVVLIDAAHDYDNVKRDFENVLSLNKSSNFVVYFHDYGLVKAGVKKFISERFNIGEIEFCGLEKDWNPGGGPIDDWEAVCISVKRDTK